jgi:hypothetical protein
MPRLSEPAWITEPAVRTLGARPSVASGPEHDLVLWVFSKDVPISPSSGKTRTDMLFATRVARDGRVIDVSTGLDLEHAGEIGQFAVFPLREPAYATWVGDRFVVAWTTRLVGIRGLTYRDGVATEASLLVPGALKFVQGVAARDETTAWLVWRHATDILSSTGTASVHYTTISNTGAIAGDTTLAVAAGAKSVHFAYDKTGKVGLFVWRVDNRILASRIDGDGTVLDTAPIEVSTTAASSAVSPFVAWRAPWFFSVWTDARSGTSTDVYGARIGADGAVADAAGNPVRATERNEEVESVSASPSAFVVSWRTRVTEQPRGFTGDVGVTRVDTNGAVLSASTLRSALANPGFSASAYNGTKQLVVFDGDHVRGSYVAEDGTASESFPIATRWPSQYAPRVAWGYDNWVTIWSEADAYSATDKDIFAGDPDLETLGARVASDGTQLDPLGFGIPHRGHLHRVGNDFVISRQRWRFFTSGAAYRVIAQQSAATPGTQVATNGSELLYVSDDLRSQRFGADLSPIAPQSEPLTPDCDPLDLAWDGNQYVLACAEIDHDGGDTVPLFLGTYSATGAPSGRTAVGRSSYNNLTTAIAGGAGLALVTWISQEGKVLAELRSGRTRELVGTQLTLSMAGRPLDAVWNGRQFVVAWQESTRALAQRIGVDGSFLDPAPFAFADNDDTQAALGAAPDGTTAIVYRMPRYPPGAVVPKIPSERLRIRLLAADGEVFDAGAEAGIPDAEADAPDGGRDASAADAGPDGSVSHDTGAPPGTGGNGGTQTGDAAAGSSGTGVPGTTVDDGGCCTVAPGSSRTRDLPLLLAALVLAARAARRRTKAGT